MPDSEDRTLVPLVPASELCRAATTLRLVVLTCRRTADHIALAHHDPDHDAYWVDDGVAYMLATAARDRAKVSAGHLSARLGQAGLQRATVIRRGRRPADFTSGFSVLQADDHHALIVHRTPTARARHFTSPDSDRAARVLAEETLAYNRYADVATNLGYRVSAVPDPQQPGRTAHLVVSKNAGRNSADTAPEAAAPSTEPELIAAATARAAAALDELLTAATSDDIDVHRQILGALGGRGEGTLLSRLGAVLAAVAERLADRHEDVPGDVVDHLDHAGNALADDVAGADGIERALELLAP